MAIIISPLPFFISTPFRSHPPHPSAGSHVESSIAVWSTTEYSLLTATSLSHSVNELCWDPSVAYKFATAGSEGRLCLWLLEEGGGRGRECELKVRRRGAREGIK